MENRRLAFIGSFIDILQPPEAGQTRLSACSNQICFIVISMHTLILHELGMIYGPRNCKIYLNRLITLQKNMRGDFASFAMSASKRQALPQRLRRAIRLARPRWSFAPYTTYNPSVRDSLVSMDGTSIPLGSATGPSRQSMLATSEIGASGTYQPATPSGMAADRPRSKAEIAGILSVPPPTTYHTDAGIRFGLSNPDAPSSSTSHQQDMLIEAPPLYTES